MRRAVVICPGRGSYNRGELGYLARRFPDPELLAQVDGIRRAAGQEPVSELDGADRFAMARHGRGDNASALICAATLGDVLAIDRAQVEIVAVTGNSMGWYSALACGGALSPAEGFRLTNTMGTLMQEASIGGQLVHPVTDTDWRPDPTRRAGLLALVAEIGAQEGHALALSIDLGGMLAIAGDAAGLAAFEAAVPRIEDRFPMRLANHAAFHTPLQAPVAARGRTLFGAERFRQPDLPLIDGRGAIWWPCAAELTALWDYTLGHQVTEPYDFARAVTVAAREFAPDLFIIAGPGTTLGGAAAQSLVQANWRGMACRDDFRARQAQDGLLVAMGMDDQRRQITKGRHDDP